MQIMNGRHHILRVTSGWTESDVPEFRAAPPFPATAVTALQAADLIVRHHFPPQPRLVRGRAHTVHDATELVPGNNGKIHRMPAAQRLNIRHADRCHMNANPRPARRRLGVGDLHQPQLAGLIKLNGSHERNSLANKYRPDLSFSPWAVWN